MPKSTKAAAPKTVKTELIYNGLTKFQKYMVGVPGQIATFWNGKANDEEAKKVMDEADFDTYMANNDEEEPEEENVDTLRESVEDYSYFLNTLKSSHDSKEYTNLRNGLNNILNDEDAFSEENREHTIRSLLKLTDDYLNHKLRKGIKENAEEKVDHVLSLKRALMKEAGMGEVQDDKEVKVSENDGRESIKFDVFVKLDKKDKYKIKSDMMNENISKIRTNKWKREHEALNQKQAMAI